MANQSILTNDQQTLSPPSKENHILSFWAVWIEHERDLRNKCHQLMNYNHTIAEDALSEVRKKARIAWPSVATKLRNPRAWLFRVTVNHCKDLHRKSKCQAITTDDLETYDIVSVTAASPAKTPFQKILQVELYQVLQTEIQNLPNDLREPFVDYYLHKKTTREISQRLGISEASVYKRNQKARARLRYQLNLYLHSDRYSRKVSPEKAVSLTSRVHHTSAASTHSYRISLPCQALQPQLWSQFSIQLGCR